MKVRYTARCECAKHNRYVTVSEVTWSETLDPIAERVADFYISCRRCGVRWREELVESEEDKDV